jgi:hypothetical protein
LSEQSPFVPAVGSTATENMSAFVRYCREKLTVFGDDLAFDHACWDVTARYWKRGHVAGFVNFTQNALQHGTRGEPFVEPFASQCKAYVRYKAAFESNKSMNMAVIAAMRELHEAFIRRDMLPDLCVIDSRLLDEAVALAKARRPGNHAPSIGTELGKIVRFIREKRLSATVPFSWKHGERWNVSTGRIGPAADQRRASSLPSAEALKALPEAFLRARTNGDIILTSVMALLACSPSRINEVFSLHVDCVIQPLAPGEEGQMLKWPGSKRHEDYAKAIPQVMSDLATTAIERLRAATAEAREIAAWYERNPNSLYLPADCSGLRGKKLTAEDLARITGLRPNSVLEFFKTKKLVPILGHAASGHRIHTFNFEDVEALILTLLPKGFPIADPSTGMKYSELLTVVRRNEFGGVSSGVWRCMIAPLKYTNIQVNFNNAHQRGIFFRLGLCSEKEPLFIKTHQLRAYLNTLAQTGGLSEIEVAAWSGRKDIRQNRAYDHRKPGDVLTAIMQRRKKSSTTSAAVRVNEPVSRTLQLTSENHGHVTELGYCEHDFSSSPCTMFMDCLNCTKHVCIKGVDPRHLERIDQSLIHAARNLQEAQQAVEQEFDGAAEWAVAHKETISRLEQLRAILMDSSIADGAVIRLSKSGRYSAVEQAMYDQGLLKLNVEEVSHSTIIRGALGGFK